MLPQGGLSGINYQCYGDDTYGHLTIILTMAVSYKGGRQDL